MGRTTKENIEYDDDTSIDSRVRNPQKMKGTQYKRSVNLTTPLFFSESILHLDWLKLISLKNGSLRTFRFLIDNPAENAD